MLIARTQKTTLHIWRRLNQIKTFAQQASSPMDSVKLAILGVARGHPFNSSDLISAIGRKFFPKIAIRTSLLPRMQIEMNPSDLGHLISFQEVIIEKGYALDLVPFQPEVVLDCGAHIGLFSLLAASAYPTAKITAFEPNPGNAKVIRRQIKINTLPISLVEAAVSDREGESWFQADYSNTGALLDDALKNLESYRVKTVDLGKFINQLNLSTLLLKVDIEGEEVRLLPVLIPYLPQKCAIFFESHAGDDGWQKLTHFLIDAGFQVQQIRCRYPYADGFASRI